METVDYIAMGGLIVAGGALAVSVAVLAGMAWCEYRHGRDERRLHRQLVTARQFAQHEKPWLRVIK